MNFTYQVNFNEEIYRRQAKLQFDIAIDEGRTDKYNYKIFIIGLLLGGTLFFVFNSKGAGIVVGPIMWIGGLIYLVVYLNYLQKVRNALAEYEKIINSELDRMSSTTDPVEITITDENFSYKSGEISFSVKWSYIKSYLELEGFIFLVIREHQFSAYYIHEDQVDPKNYAELKLFIENAIRPYPYIQKSNRRRKRHHEIIDDD